MTLEGFLWLVWALLFFKEDFSLFPPIHSSLYSSETCTETRKEETLTVLVIIRSTTVLKNTLCGFLTLVLKGSYKVHMLLQRQYTHLNPHNHVSHNFEQQESHYHLKKIRIIWELNKPKPLCHNKQDHHVLPTSLSDYSSYSNYGWGDLFPWKKLFGLLMAHLNDAAFTNIDSSSLPSGNIVHRP